MSSRLQPLRRVAVAASAASALLLGTLLAAPGAQADTRPPSGTPATVSSDALPAPQVNGVVWTQLIVGDVVYAGGEFTTARPAGAPVGSSTVARSNVLAYRLSTGALLSFAPRTNGSVRALAASADGATIYLGGTFTQVNGSTSYPYLGAVSASSGGTVTSFRPQPNGGVYALARNAATLYVGGAFTKVGASTRSRAAAVSTAGALAGWAPVVPDGHVAAIVVNGSLGRVVLGGNFTGLNGQTSNNRGSGMVDESTGTTNLPWSVGAKVRDSGSSSSITSLTSDGTNVYGTGYVFGGSSTLEGAFSAPWSSGTLRWVEDCHGDTYSSAVLGSAVYTAGHAHDCARINGFPETSPRTHHRAIAFSTAVTGTVKTNTVPNYANWGGNPAPSLLNWFPDFNTGTYTGQGQGPWSVATSGDYVVYGGEFTTVNGKAQQGMVRFAVSAIAPNTDGPRVATGDLTVTSTNLLAARALSWQAVWDRDNTSLTYALKRNGVTIFTQTVTSTFWSRPTLRFTDSSPGASPKYYVSVTDPFGNSRVGPTTAG